VHTTAVVVVVVVAKVVTEGGLVGVAGVVVVSLVAVGVDDGDGDDTGAKGSLHKGDEDQHLGHPVAVGWSRPTSGAQVQCEALVRGPLK
jgi:hypothetical protein